MLTISCSSAGTTPKLYHSTGARSANMSRFLLRSSSAFSRVSGSTKARTKASTGGPVAMVLNSAVRVCCQCGGEGSIRAANAVRAELCVACCLLWRRDSRETPLAPREKQCAMSAWGASAWAQAEGKDEADASPTPVAESFPVLGAKEEAFPTLGAAKTGGKKSKKQTMSLAEFTASPSPAQASGGGYRAPSSRAVAADDSAIVLPTGPRARAEGEEEQRPSLGGAFRDYGGDRGDRYGGGGGTSQKANGRKRRARGAACASAHSSGLLHAVCAGGACVRGVDVRPLRKAGGKQSPACVFDCPPPQRAFPQSRNRS